MELRDHHCGIASVEHRNPFHAPQFGFTQLYRKDTKNTQIVYVGTRGGMFKTTDGGTTWSQVTAGLTESVITSLAIDPKNTQIVYAGTGDGVFKTTDGGTSADQGGPGK